MESMKLKQIHSKLFIAFHGAPDQDIVSFALQCISGQGAFESLWDKEEDAAGVNTLTLTSAVSRRDDSRYISNKNLTVNSVSVTNQKNGVPMDGRAIFNLACRALKHCKKALSFMKQFLVNGQLPSGTNEDDLDIFILDNMYRILKGGDIDTIDDAEDDVAADAAATTTRPEEWFFPGWAAYKAFGPRAPTEYQTELLLLGDWPNNKRGDGGKPSSGRSAAREEVAAQQQKERDNVRGIPRDKLAALSQAEAAAEQRCHESNILALSQVIDSLHKRVELYIRLDPVRMADKIDALMEKIEEKETLMSGMATKKRKTCGLFGAVDEETTTSVVRTGTVVTASIPSTGSTSSLS
jgi:hypothetical protein